jgi:hypothetical protein
MAVLGDRCVRCGFDDYRALVIDHIHGGGRFERMYRSSPSVFYRSVIANPDGLQILCANCNLIKAIEQGEFVGRPRRRT